MEDPASLAVRSLRELLLRAAARAASGDVVVREKDGALHHVTMRAGRVVGVHVAGRFDPLLDVLRREGALTDERWHAVLEAMARSELPAGQLATEVGGVPTRRVRQTLAAQLRERLRVLLERSLTHGREAWLAPRHVPPSEGATSLTVLEALPVTVETAPPRPRRICNKRGQSPFVANGMTRRELRRAALALHPDRHPDLDPEAREALARRFAEMTAAFHGLG